jgi:hypothetical protein
MPNKENVNLEWAKYWAAKGWRLFPCLWGTIKDKNSPSHIPLTQWSQPNGTSCDIQQLTEWAIRWPNCYFCIEMIYNNKITCLDVDNKADKQGSAHLNALVAQHKQTLPFTLTVRTPSGGYHRWFLGHCAKSVNRLAQGVDVPVMAPIPGTYVPGKGLYKIISTTHGLAPLPAWIHTLAEQYKESSQRPKNFKDPMLDWNHPLNVSKAIEYLKWEAPPALERSGGDITGYKVACRVRDLCISEALCCELMLNHWYPRCEPDNKPAFIQRKVSHAYNYATSRPGEKLPEVIFNAPVNAHTAPSPLTEIVNPFFKSDSDLYKESIEPKWLIEDYIEEQTTTLFFGDRGSWKSFIALDMALCIALGYRWCDRRTQHGPVIYIAGEGGPGLKKRVRAWRLDRRVKFKPEMPFFYSYVPIKIDAGNTAVKVIEYAKAICGINRRPFLLVLDTLAKSMVGDESRAIDANKYIQCADQIKYQLGCSILIVHHSGHTNKTRAKGSVNFEAGVDAPFLVTRGSKTNPKAMTACLHSPLKMRDQEPPPDTYFKGRIITLGESKYKKPITSVSLKHIKDFAPPPITIDSKKKR